MRGRLLPWHRMCVGMAAASRYVPEAVAQWEGSPALLGGGALVWNCFQLWGHRLTALQRGGFPRFSLPATVVLLLFSLNKRPPPQRTAAHKT